MATTLPFQWLVSDPGYRSATAAARKTMMDLVMTCAFGARIDRTYESLVALGYSATVSDLQRAFRSNGVLLRELKVYTFALWYLKQGPSTVGFVKARNIAVNARYEDPDLAKYAEKLSAGPHVSRILSKYAKLNNDVLTVQEHSSIMGGVLSCPELREYTGKFIFKKMTFILKTGISFDDLLLDMQEAAVYNLLRTYPNWSGPGHALAIAKSAVKRRGHNIIKEHAAASRSHLIREADGTYSAVNVSMDPDVAAEFFDSTTEFSRTDGSTPESRVQDLILSLTALRNRAQYEWQRGYLDLCLDQGRDLFNTWCEQACIRISEDDSSSSRFRTAAALYLGVTPEQIASFLKELRISARLD